MYIITELDLAGLFHLLPEPHALAGAGADSRMLESGSVACGSEAAGQGSPAGTGASSGASGQLTPTSASPARLPTTARGSKSPVGKVAAKQVHGDCVSKWLSSFNQCDHHSQAFRPVALNPCRLDAPLVRLEGPSITVVN